MTDEARFFLKKIGGLNLGPTGGPKWGFCHFIKFGLSVFLEIAYNDSLQQCLKSSRGKTHEKYFGGPNFDKTSQNWARN